MHNDLPFYPATKARIGEAEQFMQQANEMHLF